MATRDKLIFPSTILRILCHFSIHFPSSDHFPVVCAVDYATVKRSEAQFDRGDLVWQLLPFLQLHPHLLPPLL